MVGGDIPPSVQLIIKLVAAPLASWALYIRMKGQKNSLKPYSDFFTITTSEPIRRLTIKENHIGSVQWLVRSFATDIKAYYDVIFTEALVRLWPKDLKKTRMTRINRRTNIGF